MDSKSKENKNGENRASDPLFSGKPPKKHPVFSSPKFQIAFWAAVALAAAYAIFIAKLPLNTIAASFASLIGGLILLNLFIGMFMD